MNTQILVLSLLVVALAGFLGPTEAATRPFNPSRFKRDAQKQFEQASNVRVSNHQPNKEISGPLQRSERDTNDAANDNPSLQAADAEDAPGQADDNVNAPAADADEAPAQGADDNATAPAADDNGTAPAADDNPSLQAADADDANEEAADDDEKTRVARDVDQDYDFEPAHRRQRETKKELPPDEELESLPVFLTNIRRGAWRMARHVYTFITNPRGYVNELFSPEVETFARKIKDE